MLDSAGARRSLREAAGHLGVGVDAVLALIATGELLAAKDAITLHLHDEPHVDAKSLADLASRLEHRLRPPSSNRTTSVRVALRRLAEGCKPWPALIGAVLNGSIRLHRNGTKALSLRDCRIDRTDLTKLDRLASHDIKPEVASPWISDHDAWERLNCGMRNLRHLVRSNALESSGRFDGRTFLRTDVDRLAGELICVPEIAARLDGKGLWIEPHLASLGLVPDAGGFLPRASTEAMLGFR